MVSLTDGHILFCQYHRSNALSTVCMVWGLKQAVASCSLTGVLSSAVNRLLPHTLLVCHLFQLVVWQVMRRSVQCRGGGGHCFSLHWRLCAGLLEVHYSVQCVCVWSGGLSGSRDGHHALSLGSKTTGHNYTPCGCCLQICLEICTHIVAFEHGLAFRPNDDATACRMQANDAFYSCLQPKYLRSGLAGPRTKPQIYLTGKLNLHVQAVLIPNK